MELHAEIQKLCPRTIIRICLRGARRSEQDYAKEPSSEFVSRWSEQDYAKEPSSEFVSRRSEQDYAKEPSSKYVSRRREQDYAKEPSSEFVSGAHGEANKTMPRNHHQNFSVSLVRCLSM